MSKIICSRLECKFCNDNYICSKDKVHLIFCSIMTLHNGRREFLDCKDFEETDDEIYQNMKKYLEERFDYHE